MLFMVLRKKSYCFNLLLGATINIVFLVALSSCENFQKIVYTGIYVTSTPGDVEVIILPHQEQFGYTPELKWISIEKNFLTKSVCKDYSLMFYRDGYRPAIRNITIVNWYSTKQQASLNKFHIHIDMEEIK
jgi:hypothetical protein